MNVLDLGAGRAHTRSTPVTLLRPRSTPAARPAVPHIARIAAAASLARTAAAVAAATAAASPAPTVAGTFLMLLTYCYPHWVLTSPKTAYWF